MGKLSYEIETRYEKGDVVVFEKGKMLMVGVITGYSLDQSAGNSIWYDIAVGNSRVYTYMNGGDIAEFDILAKVSDNLIIDAVKNFVKGQV